MDLSIAFMLGLAGSLHCLGMCGPLALAIPFAKSRSQGPGSAGLVLNFNRMVAGRLAYNGGRILAYALIGALFGLVGRSLLLAGFQRWLSIGVGIALIAGLIASRKYSVWRPLAAFVGWLKSTMGSVLRNPSPGSLLLLGVLNGFLPCGLVYVAAAGAAATAGAISGALYMTVFGLGTAPAMFAIGFSGKLIPASWRAKLPRVVPVTVCVVAALLIVRGMALGIPYISPAEGHSCCAP